jgi:hypothetical protein
MLSAPLTPPPGLLTRLGLDCLFLALELLELNDLLAVSECSRHFAKSLAVGPLPSGGVWAKLRPADVNAAVCAQPTVRRARLVCAAYRPALKYHELAKILARACTTSNLGLAQWSARQLNFGLDPTQLASLMFATCTEGNVRMAKWLVAAFNIGRNTAGSATLLFRDACKGGRLGVAAWLWTVFALTPRDARAADNYALRHACAGGHLDVVEWLVETFGLDAADAAARDSAAFKAACRNGRLLVADWLARRFGLVPPPRGGEPLLSDWLARRFSVVPPPPGDGPSPIGGTRGVAAGALAEACHDGRLDVAKWLLQQDPACKHDLPAGCVARALRRACRRGGTPLGRGGTPFAKWLLTVFDVSADDRHRAATVACANGGSDTIAIVRRLLKRARRPMETARQLELLLATCAGGLVELYSWLVARFGQPAMDPTWAGRMLLMAAQYGRHVMVEWLSAKYAALAPDVADVLLLSASQCGHVMVVNWAITQTTPVEPQLGRAAFIVACASGRLAVAQRLARHFELTAADVAADDSIAMRVASAGGHFVMMDWLSDTFGAVYDDDMECGPQYNLPIAVDPHSRGYADSSDEEGPGNDADSIICDSDGSGDDEPTEWPAAQPNAAYATIGRATNDPPANAEEPSEDAGAANTIEYGQSVLNILDI